MLTTLVLFISIILKTFIIVAISKPLNDIGNMSFETEIYFTTQISNYMLVSILLPLSLIELTKKIMANVDNKNLVTYGVFTELKKHLIPLIIQFMYINYIIMVLGVMLQVGVTTTFQIEISVFYIMVC